MFRQQYMGEFRLNRIALNRNTGHTAQ